MFVVTHTVHIVECAVTSAGRRVGGQAALGLGLVNQATEQNQTGDAAYTEALSLAREILPQVQTYRRTDQFCCNVFLSLALISPNNSLISLHLSTRLLVFSCLPRSTVRKGVFTFLSGLCRSQFLSAVYARGQQMQSGHLSGDIDVSHTHTGVLISRGKQNSIQRRS